MSKLDQSIYPDHYVGYIDPEDFCDMIRYQMKKEGVEMSDETYEKVWDDVVEHNRKNFKSSLTEQEKYLVRQKRNELEAVNE